MGDNTLLQLKNTSIAIYCAGKEAKKFLYKCSVIGIPVEYFIDTVKTGSCCGRDIYNIDTAPNIESIYIVAACKENYYFEIKQLLIKSGKKEFEDFCYYKMINRWGGHKKLCVINMNCYMYPIIEYMEKSKWFKETCFVYPLEPIYARKGGEIDELILKNADVYIHQIISNKNPFDVKSSDDYCIPRLKPECLKITVPNFYPDGAEIFYPYLKRELEEGFFYEDEFIDEAIKRNCVNPKQVYEYVNSIIISASRALDINKWLEYMEYRDIRYDVKVSSYIKHNYKHEKLFNDKGHPSSKLMLYICRELAKLLSINDIEENNSVQLCEIGYEHFVWKPVMDLLGLDFSQEKVRVNALGIDYGLEPIEFIQAYMYIR